MAVTPNIITLQPSHTILPRAFLKNRENKLVNVAPNASSHHTRIQVRGDIDDAPYTAVLTAFSHATTSARIDAAHLRRPQERSRNGVLLWFMRNNDIFLLLLMPVVLFVFTMFVAMSHLSQNDSTITIPNGFRNAFRSDMNNITWDMVGRTAVMRSVEPDDSIKNDRWIPLTEVEQIGYLDREKLVCGQPFLHCCLGQGRQLHTRHTNISQLFIRWSEPLASLTTLLEYMSRRNIPCNLWFFGMSLAGDHAIGAICELMRDAGYKLDPKECVPYENPRWNEKDALSCTMSRKGMPTSQYYQLVNHHRRYCPKVTIAHSGMNHIARNESYIYSQLGGVMIINHGVHCNEPGCVTTKLNDIFTDQVLAMTEQGWHILWRETEHQHFATPNGYHGRNVSKKECRALGTADGDYRNEEAEEFLSELALTTNKTVPIVPIAKASEPLHFMHAYDSERKTFDCTHYVYSPWRFELTWDGILQGLKRLEKQ